jgi:hypothetical protein
MKGFLAGGMANAFWILMCPTLERNIGSYGVTVLFLDENIEHMKGNG